jgi:hypothetical protein
VAAQVVDVQRMKVTLAVILLLCAVILVDLLW